MAPMVKAIAFDAATWRELGPRMLELERHEWRARAFSEREMRWQATNRDAVVMTSWDGATLIGFAVAGPAWTKGRASLLNVLIDPAYRGRGLVWPLIAAVERALAARGIRELDIDARVDDGEDRAVVRRTRLPYVEQIAAVYATEQLARTHRLQISDDVAVLVARCDVQLQAAFAEIPKSFHDLWSADVDALANVIVRRVRDAIRLSLGRSGTTDLI